MSEQLNIHLKTGEGAEVATLLQGEAPEQKPLFRKGTTVKGTLSVPADHLEKPSNWLTTPNEGEDSPLQFSYVEVDREKRTIKFIEDKGFPWESTYTGTLELDENFKKFKINTGETFAPLILGNFFRMNRSFFESIPEGGRIASLLMNFEAKVDRQIKESDDGRANTTSLRSQAVESNLPPSFKLNLPIFKGCPRKLVEIEIYIDPKTLNCSLVSPEANDYIELIKEEEINKQVKRIEEAQPKLRIFEV